MSEPWVQAGNTARKNKYFWWLEEWDHFAEKAGWTSYSGLGKWTKRQFKAALREMPEDHPDRWKFEAGAKYASLMNEDSAGKFAIFVMVKVLGVVFLSIFGVMNIAIGLSGYYGNLLLALPAIALWVYAGHWIYKRDQYMKRMLKPTPPVRRLGEFL